MTVLVLRNTCLIDGRDSAVRERMTVTIEGQSIADIAEDVPTGAISAARVA